MIKRFLSGIHSILIILCACFNGPLFAQLSPGDLHQSHAEFEGLENCTKCHSEGRQLAPEKCLDCHTLLRDRINQKKGLHARAEYSQCEVCHIEHQGRDFELIYWKEGKDKFNHGLTGYELEGAHSTAGCEKCHTQKNMRNPQLLLEKKKNLNQTFLGLDQSCLTCHRDEHRAQLGEKCLDCHLYNAWKPAPKFNHDQTRYVLTGSHKTVGCVKCHSVLTDHKFADDSSYQKFTNLQFGQCQDCHDDVHQGRFGADCASCHNTTKWQNYAEHKFDHNKTSFSLKGKHAQVKCEACHKPGQPLKIARFAACLDCHTDYHQGQFKSRKQKGACEECHSESGYVPAKFTLLQHNEGRYPLQGAHLAVPCIACHKKISISNDAPTIQFKFQSMRCVSCHKDPHNGEVDFYLTKTSSVTQKNGCEHCHSLDGWTSVKFDHDQSNFKLNGKHRETACKDCHQFFSADKQLHFKNVPQECSRCHTDVHNNQFTVDGQVACQNCHTPQDWKEEIFNHDLDSNFKLTGGHQSVPCADCHKPVNVNGSPVILYKPLDLKCASCHGLKQ